MRQDKIHVVEAPEQNFYLVVDRTRTGLAIFVLSEEPSKHTEEAQADACIRLDVKSKDDENRIIVRLFGNDTEHTIAFTKQRQDRWGE